MPANQDYSRLVRQGLERARTAASSSLPSSQVQRFCDRFQDRRQDQLQLLLRNHAFGQRAEITLEYLKRASRSVHHGPAQARKASFNALAASRALQSRDFPARLACDLCAEALSWVANAERLGEDFGAAERVWAEAFTELDLGSGDPLLRAALEQRLGLLRAAQRRFGEAESLFNAAASSFQRFDHVDGLARARFNLGRIHYLRGEAGRSLESFHQAVETAHLADDPGLLLLTFDGLLHALEDLGQHFVALALISSFQDTYLEQAPPSMLRRHRWLRGRIFLACDGAAEAIESLDQVRREFLEEGNHLDASLCALDLALAYARCRNWLPQKRLAEEMYPVFCNLQTEREAVAAFLLYVDAAHAYEASVVVVEDVHRITHPLRKGGSVSAVAPPANA
jgi:tetratricopeptide (TPR) repeat protein